MDGAMRDLSLIREQTDETDATVRRWMLYGLAAGTTTLLVVALCAQLGPSSGPEIPNDPLARLDALSRSAPFAELGEEPPPPTVDRIALSFPERLTEEPPELAAMLAAAAAEAAHPDALVADELTTPSEASHVFATSGFSGTAPASDASRRHAAERVPELLPAAVSATEGDDIARAALLDPLVSASFPAERVGEPAREGHDGRYTLQVISYDSAEGAQAFAAGLRARGHRAFVMRATVEGRGTVYRVRIGPFETLSQANAYRARFEQSEHMNTIVIRRREAD